MTRFTDDDLYMENLSRGSREAAIQAAYEKALVTVVGHDPDWLAEGFLLAIGDDRFAVTEGPPGNGVPGTIEVIAHDGGQTSSAAFGGAVAGKAPAVLWRITEPRFHVPGLAWKDADGREGREVYLVSPSSGHRKIELEQSRIDGVEVEVHASPPLAFLKMSTKAWHRAPIVVATTDGEPLAVTASAVVPGPLHALRLASIAREITRAAGGAETANKGSEQAAADQRDDLKRIRGIGVLIEKRLISLGITSYRQIASWSEADIERISAALDFKGRIERENWVAQARILASGGQTDFSRRMDRGELESQAVSEATATRAEGGAPRKLIYVSHRPADERETTDRICARLDKSFETVRRDLPPANQAGPDGYIAHIAADIASCEAVLVVVGPKWLARDSDGRRYIDNPGDAVRLEIASALRDGKRVVPVLIGNASMPRPEELAGEISVLARLQAAIVRNGSIEADAIGLARDLVRVLDVPLPPSPVPLPQAIEREPTPLESAPQLSAAPSSSAEPKPRVFVGYVRPDLGMAEAIVKALEPDLDFMIDLGRVLVDDWMEALDRMLRDADAAIILASSAGIRSTSLHYEVGLLEARGITAITVRIDDIRAWDLPRYLAERQWVDADRILHDGATQSMLVDTIRAAARKRREQALVADEGGLAVEASALTQRAAATDPSSAQKSFAGASLEQGVDGLQRIGQRFAALGSIGPAGGEALRDESRGGFLLDPRDIAHGLDPDRLYLLAPHDALIAAAARAGHGGSSTVEPILDKLAVRFPAADQVHPGVPARILRIVWRSSQVLGDLCLLELSRDPTGVMRPLRAALSPISRADKLLVLGFTPEAQLLFGNLATNTIEDVLDPPPGRVRFVSEARMLPGAALINQEDNSVVGVQIETASSNSGDARARAVRVAVTIDAVIGAIRRRLALVNETEAWAEAGRPRGVLLSKRRLAEIEKELATEPALTWQKGVLGPHLAAARAAIDERRQRWKRAAAVALAVLPLVAAMGAERWIASASIALSAAPPTSGGTASPADVAAVTVDGETVLSPGRWLRQVQGRVTRTLAPPPAHATAIMALALNQAGTRLVALSADRWLRGWSIEDGRMLWETELDRPDLHEPGLSIARRQGKEFVFVPIEIERTMTFDLESGQGMAIEGTGLHDSLWRPRSFASHGQALAFAQIDNRIASVRGYPDGRFRYEEDIDKDGFQFEQVFSPHEAPVTAAALARGPLLIGATVAANGTVIIQSRSSKVDGNWSSLNVKGTCGGACSAVAFSDSGLWLLTAGSGGKAQVWSLSEGNDRGSMLAEVVHGQAVTTALFVSSAEDRFLGLGQARFITAGDDGASRLWRFSPGESETTELLAVIRGHGAPITHAEVAADGRLLVTADIDGNVRITDLRKAELLGSVDIMGLWSSLVRR